ncbi:MAG: MFS transporter [Fimbriimonadales bacterium]|nr:MFS transporter [Fimbriimonadales bacterium]
MERRESTFVIAIRVLKERPSLAVMMFLQYAIWGAWAVDLSGYLNSKGFSGVAVSLIYNALPIMNLIVPFTAGQIADRFMPAQRALMLFHFVGGILLFVLALQRELIPLTALMLGYAFFYAPTLALSNSVALRNLKNPEVEFGPIRMWGTVGWIAANYGVSFIRTQFNSQQWGAIDLFVIAGAVSLVAALACLTLPNTPPAKEEAADPLAFREALVLLRDPNYRVFFIIAMIVATELPLYYQLTSPFLRAAGPVVGITDATVPAWMNIAQIAEIFTIALMLPAVLPVWGVRKAMLLGIFAWPARYLVFALTWHFHQQAPWTVWLSVAALALHGFCYVFFFVVAFIYTDMVAPRDIRSSAQSLINVAILGIGMIIGFFFAGWLSDTFKVGETTNYAIVFSIGAVITILAGIVFAVLFREKPAGEVAPQTN